MTRGKLAYGMTVQGSSAGLHLRVAHCVVCGWNSEPITYEEANRIACSEGSHTCSGPKKPRY